MSSAWVKLPSLGCFTYFERDPVETPELCRAQIAAVLAGLAIDEGDVKMVAYQGRKWRKFSWRAVDEAIADPEVRSIALLVGTPADVHLGARICVRHGKRTEGTEPPRSWLAAESVRWPASRMVPTCRHWLALGAEHGAPISGGVIAAASLLDAKNEVSSELESMAFEKITAAEALFTARLHRDRPELAWDKLRRLYPITLLGPRFASPAHAELLRAAGARVDPVRNSLIVEAYPSVIPAWDPEYLAATIELRRVLWPLTFQNLADATGLGLGARFEVPAKLSVPSWEPSVEEVRRELARQQRAFDAIVKRDREAGRVAGP